MKIGDWVRKAGGDFDVGRVGVILKIASGDDISIITVYTGNEIKSWAGHLVEVISAAPLRE